MLIGDRIREAREIIKLSQKQLADKLEMDPSQYSKIERGKVMPTVLQIVEIGKIVERSLDWLITGTLEKNSAKSDYIDDYKDQLELAKQNIALLNQIQSYKDRIHELETDVANLKNKRSAPNKLNTFVAERKQELIKKGK